jgi:hypothetical protein
MRQKSYIKQDRVIRKNTITRIRRKWIAVKYSRLEESGIEEESVAGWNRIKQTRMESIRM